MSDQKTDRKERELGALWSKTFTSRDGKERTYYTGTIDVKKLAAAGVNNVYVEENVFKTEDKHPALRVYIDRPKSKDSSGGGQQKRQSQNNDPFGDETL